MSIQSFTRTCDFGKVEINSAEEQPQKSRDVTGISLAPLRPPAINTVDPPYPQHSFVGGEGLGGSAGGRAVQLTRTLWLLSVLASKNEHTQRWEGGLVQWSPWQGFTPPHLLEAYRGWHKDMLPTIPWWWISWLYMGPLLPLGIDPFHTSPDLGTPSSMYCEQAAAPRTSLDQSQALHWGHGSALATLAEKESQP